MSFRQGARQFFERRGGGGWQNPYVTDGLIAMWDGEWNAGGGVHDASAATWKDLIGNCDLIKNPYATWTDDSLFISEKRNLAYLLGTISSVESIEACFDMSSESSNGQGRGLVCLTNQRSMMGNGLFGIRSRGEPSVAMMGTSERLISAFSASVIYGASSSNDKIFFDGVEQEVGAASGNWALGDNVVIGSTSTVGNGSVGITGKCHIVRLYSRALTAAEVAHNYEIDKVRFNLP